MFFLDLKNFLFGYIIQKDFKTLQNILLCQNSSVLIYLCEQIF